MFVTTEPDLAYTSIYGLATIVCPEMLAHPEESGASIDKLNKAVELPDVLHHKVTVVKNVPPAANQT